jgi:hypothetical protein
MPRGVAQLAKTFGYNLEPTPFTSLLAQAASNLPSGEMAAHHDKIIKAAVITHRSRELIMP